MPTVKKYLHKYILLLFIFAGFMFILIPPKSFADKKVSINENIVPSKTNPESQLVNNKIKVGIYNFNPLIFVDETGKASGLFPEILNYIAEKEDWEIIYIPGSWSDSLERVEKGEIDLSICIAHTPEREAKLDFTKDYLILDWASVFKQKGSNIQTIFDLQDKTVSVLKSGVTTDSFKRVLSQFGIICNIIEKNENIENLKAVHQKEADAGVCPNIYGTMVEGNYNIERTSIVFAPIQLGFATKKGSNHKVLSALNIHIQEMKADKESVYYELRNKWIGAYSKDKIFLAKWVVPILVIVIFLLLILVIFNIALKEKVKLKTSELLNINDVLKLSEESYRILFEQAMQDITERKLAEAALRHSEEKFKVVFEQAPVGIVITNSKGVIVDCNRYFADIFGATPEQYCGMDLLEKLPEGGVKQNLISSLKDYQIHHYNGHYVSVLTGRKLYLNITSQKVISDLVITIIIDMTKYNEAEEENQRLQYQLIQAQKMESIGRLAGGVAHDFNNMLGVIIGHVEILLDGVDEKEPMYKGLVAVNKAANRSANLTKQLLAFARKQTVNPQVIDLNSAVGGMLSMVERLIGEDMNLVWIGGENGGYVKIDPAQIDQIVVNLCINARDAILEKYSSRQIGDIEITETKQIENETKGEITIETSIVTFDEAYCLNHVEALPGSYVMLAVSDNGCGINKDRLSMIFDPFFTTKDIDRGTGLGLASVYGIVKQNNGFINVYSEVNEGSTFRIYLPKHDKKRSISSYNTHSQDIDFKESKDNDYRNITSDNSSESLEDVELLAQNEEASIKTDESEIVYGSETILFVEDEAWLLELGDTMLKRLGYKVLIAATPKEAIDLALNYLGQIDLLITDVIMPEMNGRELARELFNVRPNMKSLFMSGYTANVIAHHGVLEQGVYFIQKPFSIQELSGKIREILDIL
ncbi:MAG: transporter substrate-binding domain-containing protein [Desulfamplus sp.]|nr:transporter substrate-binding domain-containing protein [Desulfamplus sp.]